METRNWYPKWVYDKREDITRENMRRYDRQMEELFEARMAKEKELGRKLTIKERYEMSKEYEL